MARLAVIVAQGGINSAGRTSGYNAYKRLIYSTLSQKDKTSVLQSLNQLCSYCDRDRIPVASEDESALLSKTLVRKLSLFNPEHIQWHKKVSVQKESTFIINRNQLPDPLPHGWKVSDLNESQLQIRLNENCSFFHKQFLSSPVSVASELPYGFHPEKLYPSRSHPRGLAMSVIGASDAVQSMGIDWEFIRKTVPADKISVYAGSSMSQLDQNSNAGMLQARLKGKRVSAKQLPLGFAEMPADFINAYILGSFGSTGTNMGACASFLYNLKQGVEDIRSGRSRIVVVGNSEAPITPEIIDGYSTMGALATDQALRKLDKLTDKQKPDYRRACRPFDDNAGFVLGESAQFFVLMDDDLVIESGANILGSVADVFVNADGFKKSISSPGAGNYVTAAKAVSLSQQLFGNDALHHSFLLAHGTGTAQNRVSESHIISEIAKTFSIKNWPVAAIKSYVGHSLGAAGGDQLLTALGIWNHGIIPGIHSIKALAKDISTENVDFLISHKTINPEIYSTAFLNSKGFGGNNATATLISPHKTQQMLLNKHSKITLNKWKKQNEVILDNTSVYEDAYCRGEISPFYSFGERVLDASDILLKQNEITLGDQKISLESNHMYDAFLN